MSVDDLTNLLDNLNIDTPLNGSDSIPVSSGVLNSNLSNSSIIDLSNRNKNTNQERSFSNSDNNRFDIDVSGLELTLNRLKEKRELIFNSLNSNSNSDTLQFETMSQFKPEYLNCVPQFDGNPSELNRYLATCKSLIDNFYDINNRNSFQNIYLLNCLIGKLSGNARLVVNVQNVSTWEDLKETLNRNFADRRDETCLNRDLVMLRQNSNESPQHFYDRVLEILNLLCSYVDAHETAAIAAVKRDMYMKLALTTFLSGLREPLGNTIRCMRPKDLAEAIQFVTQENNLKYFQNHGSLNPNKSQILRPKQPVANFQSMPPQSNQWAMPRFNRNFNSHTSHNQFNTPFPSQPIPIRPNPNFRPQRLPTNSEVFGKPKQNVFRPNQPKPLPNPTPMSVCTQNTFKQNIPGPSGQQNQYYQQRPKFHVEELYNAELDESYEEYPYDPYYESNYYFNPDTTAQTHLEPNFTNNEDNFGNPDSQTSPQGNEQNFRVSESEDTKL